jgi:hypothetical protein
MNWKRVLILAAILTALGMAVVLALRFFISPQKIAAAILPRMQEILDRQVSINSSQLSFFPPGVRISGLSIANKPPFDDKPLAHIDHIDASVQLFPLLLGKIKIKELVVDGWEMLLEKDSSGAVNYDFFRARSIFPGKQEQVQEPLCRRFRLNDGRLLFRNDSTGVRFVMGNIRLDYDLKGERLSDISGELKIDSLFVWMDAGNFLIYPDAVEADWRGFYSALHDSVAFRRCNWRIDAFAGRLDGAIANIGSRPSFNLRLLSERTELVNCRDSRVIQAFPVARDMLLAGQARIDISYAAIAGSVGNRNLRGRISLSDFAGTDEEHAVDVRSKLIECNFNEKTLSVFTESAEVNGFPATLRMTVDDYQSPTISGEAIFDCSADLAAKLLSVETSTKVAGNVAVNLSGFLKSSSPEQSRIFGSVMLGQLSIADSLRKIGIDTLSLDLQLTGDRALLSRFDLAIGNNKLLASGSIADFPMLFATNADSRRRPYFEGVISADNFDFDTLSSFAPDAGSDSSSTSNLLDRIVDLNSSSHLRVTEGRLFGIAFSDLEARLSVVNRIVYSDSAECRMFGGRVAGEVVVDYTNRQEPEVDLDVRTEEIMADAFLDRFTRFGPRLTGELDLQLSAKWRGTTTESALSSVMLKGDAVLDDGRVAPFDLSRRFEDEIGVPAFEKGKVEDLVGSFLFADQTLRFTTLAFDSGDIEYSASGSISMKEELGLTVTRKVSKDDIRTLRNRPDFNRNAKDKSPKSVVFELRGTTSAPVISITGTR